MVRSRWPSALGYSSPPAQWMYRAMVVLVLALGLVLRGVHLNHHAYWVDEVHTAVRVSGYTKADIAAAQFDNGVHGAAELNTYQTLAQPSSLGSVLQTLAQHPEHPPLYYLLVRWWQQGWQQVGIVPSITVMRSLSVVLGGLALCAVILLGGELFPSRATQRVAVAILALSPLHILYAQEAREYSLWTLMTLLSCWSLVRALRRQTLGSWWGYGVTLVLGWYTHLLFATVVMAHGIYGGLVSFRWGPLPRDPDEWSNPLPLPGSQPGWKTFRPLLVAIALSGVAFIPWIMVCIVQLQQVQTVVAATQRGLSLGYLIDVWGRSLGRVLLNTDLAGGNSLLLLGVLYACYHLWGTAPRQTSSLMLLLIGFNAVVLIIPDVMAGGISSSRIRYLIPAYIGIQLVIAHCLTHLAVAPRPTEKGQSSLRRGWHQGVRRLSQALLVLLLVNGAIAGVLNGMDTTNWAKSDKSRYYPQMAMLINQEPNPLIITDTSATYTLVLSAQLRPDIGLQLVNRPRRLTLPRTWNQQPISAVFVFTPSPVLQRVLETEHGLSLQPVVQQNQTFQLLQHQPPLSRSSFFDQ